MNKSKSSLFLMELILAILIFSVASAVCIQIFVKAHLISKDTQILNQAVTLTSSAAELFYGYKGDVSEVVSTLDTTGTSEITEGNASLYYDDAFNECAKDNAVYKMEILSLTDGDMIRGEITTFRLSDSSEVYSVDCSYYKDPLAASAKALEGGAQ